MKFTNSNSEDVTVRPVECPFESTSSSGSFSISQNFKHINVLHSTEKLCWRKLTVRYLKWIVRIHPTVMKVIIALYISTVSTNDLDDDKSKTSYSDVLDAILQLGLVLQNK